MTTHNLTCARYTAHHRSQAPCDTQRAWVYVNLTCSAMLLPASEVLSWRETVVEMRTVTEDPCGILSLFKRSEAVSGETECNIMMTKEVIEILPIIILKFVSFLWRLPLWRKGLTTFGETHSGVVYTPRCFSGGRNPTHLRDLVEAERSTVSRHR